MTVDMRGVGIWVILTACAASADIVASAALDPAALEHPGRSGQRIFDPAIRYNSPQFVEPVTFDLDWLDRAAGVVLREESGAEPAFVLAPVLDWRQGVLFADHPRYDCSALVFSAEEAGPDPAPIEFVPVLGAPLAPTGLLALTN